MRRVALIGENSIEYVNVLLNIWNAGYSAVLIDWRIPQNLANECPSKDLLYRKRIVDGLY